MDDLMARLLEDLLRHRGKVVGTLLGLVLGWMVIEYGVIKSLFVVVCLAVGYALGSRQDRESTGRR